MVADDDDVTASVVEMVVPPPSVDSLALLDVAGSIVVLLLLLYCGNTGGCDADVIAFDVVDVGVDGVLSFVEDAFEFSSFCYKRNQNESNNRSYTNTYHN